MSDKNTEKEQENIVVDKDGKEIKQKRLGFFKKVWYSIVKFEKYLEMSLEGTSRALKYLLQITSIFVLIIACIGMYNVNINLDGFIKNIQENLPDFKYSEGKVTLDSEEENKVYTLKDTNLNFGTVIIDLNTEDESVIEEYENTIKNNSDTNNIGIIILKDEVVQIVKLLEGSESESRISMTYDEVMESLFKTTEVELTKSKLVEYLDGNGRIEILIVNFFAYLIAYFIIYISSSLIYVLVLALIGFASAKITRMKLTFAQLFAISTYAFTLSNILNMIYFITNYFFGITIKYFEVAYIAIAYIYLVTVMFLIKSDSLRKQEKQVKKEEKKETEEANGQEQI